MQPWNSHDADEFEQNWLLLADIYIPTRMLPSISHDKAWKHNNFSSPALGKCMLRLFGGAGKKVGKLYKWPYIMFFIFRLQVNI